MPPTLLSEELDGVLLTELDRTFLTGCMGVSGEIEAFPWGRDDLWWIVSRSRLDFCLIQGDNGARGARRW